MILFFCRQGSIIARRRNISIFCSRLGLFLLFVATSSFSALPWMLLNFLAFQSLRSSFTDFNFITNLNMGLPVFSSSSSLSSLFYEVGVITFDMSLSIKYEDLASHMKELAKVIARELEVNTSQVHLLNFTSKGNESLIRWAIYPAGSANFFSNSTAMDIIVRLTEHRLQLPDNFGSYKMIQWTVEPPSRRSWWRRHFLAVVAGVMITLVIGCLTTFGIWFVWKRKQELGPYKPVGAVVPEQELQPLQT